MTEVKMKIKEIKAQENWWKKNFEKINRLLEVKRNISRSKKHLDLGCGIGTFCHLLARKYPKVKVYGADINKEKIKTAKKRYKLKNLNFNTKIKRKFDSITCIFVLHEVKEVNKVLNKLYRHLNKEGKILIYDFRKTSKKKFRKAYEKNPNPNKDSFEEEYKEHNRWTTKRFEKLCKKPGFKTLKIKPVGDYYLVYIGKKLR